MIMINGFPYQSSESSPVETCTEVCLTPDIWVNETGDNMTGDLATHNITLLNGGQLWDNATCTFLESPDGSTVTEVCNA